MKFLLFSLLWIQPAFSITHLLLVGGGKRPPEAMQAFVNSSGGAPSKIVVCPWASESLESSEIIKEELLKQYGAVTVEILPAFPMNADDQKKTSEMISTATGIFFAGGDQNKIMDVVQAQKLKPLLQSVFQKGVTFGGTSAGTAVMSERMITGDAPSPTSPPPLSEGLGLLPNHLIVDQHFLVRQRFNRLATLVMTLENTIGLGVDEGTALMVTDGISGEVLGPSQVLLFQRSAEHRISVDYFLPREKFALPLK